MKQKTGILHPLEIPLHGRHMIEASAGTGKTYNITRIYVRLLVESGLSVKQILVMTFTEAATEEIKDRLAAFINELLHDFYTSPCSFSKALSAKNGEQNTFNTLSIAQLELDLASIYTINGFCQRVIGRFGLSMSLPQNAELVTDFHAITLTYVSDALRMLRNDSEKYLLLQNESFHDPVNFLRHFGNLIGARDNITVPSAESFIVAQKNGFNQCWSAHAQNIKQLISSIQTQSETLYQGVKSGEKAVSPEIEEAITWLCKPHLLANEETSAFFNTWLGLGSVSKAQSKEAEAELINPAFNKLFSSVRVKNYVKAGMDVDDPLIVQAQRLLADIKTAKGLGDIKKTLVNNIRKVPLYQSVYQIINRVNEMINQHKQIYGVIGFNDQIEGVASAMEKGGEALIESLQHEYPAALVDEFQDTDEHQYSILQHLFPKHEQDRLLLMIGDPKQAIYSFRGGDIYTYLRAKEASDYRWGMDVNYRSSSEVIHCYNRLFHGAPLSQAPIYLFDKNIAYPIVKAAENPAKKLSIIDDLSTQNNAAFSFVCANALSHESPHSIDSTPSAATKDVQTHEILSWCANEAARLLADVYIDEDGRKRLVQSEDIAILVRSKGQAALVKQIFSAKGLATVFLGEKTPLFESQQALHILWFLQAVHLPTRENIRKAITTGLVKINGDSDTDSIVSSATLLIDDGHSNWETVFSSLAIYRDIWSQKGVYALMQSVIQHAVVQYKESERQLTNYMHISELLADAWVTNSSALLLIHWLHKQIAEASSTSAHELRLESDQKLIKIVTQHKSKGLEYPIVFLPYANHIYNPSSSHTAVFHDDKLNRLIQLGVSSEAKHKSEEEALAEDMRLLYVSLTRPILRCYLGMFTLASSNKSALTRALGVSVNNKACDDPGEYVYKGIKDTLQDISPYIFVTMADNLLPIHQQLPPPQSQALHLLPFNSNIDRTWQVTSFSKLSRNLVTGDFGQFGERLLGDVSLRFSRDIESEDNVQASQTRKDLNIRRLEGNENTADDYRFTFPKGPDAGNLLHDVLELIDFAKPNVAGALDSLNVSTVNDQLVDKNRFSTWIDQIVATPFTALNDFCLQDLTDPQTLKESEFYFPIHDANTQALLAIVQAYRQQLSQDFSFTLPPNLTIHSETLRGAMHGFIDLIFQCNGKYYVADYKSNFLGNDLEYYNATDLALDILKHHYDIQYLLYSLALHRYLTAFLPDYHYEQHFGGVYYLYLRGMEGQNKEHRPDREASDNNGLFFHKVDGQLMVQLDQLFASNSEAASGPTQHTELSQGLKQ